MVWIFLLSGLFLGWSLGANDTANIFGTAVGTRMVKFSFAAFIASVFVILGAVISGAGAAHTYGKLGSVNALAGSFTAALAAAITVSFMTKLGLPVSTTQAIVGAIIGWDIFSHTLIDTHTLTKILSTWVICPILAGAFSFVLFKISKAVLLKIKIHLLEMDLYTRLGLILIGAFGAYSLGANNIANVMGVFVTAHPFKDVNLGLFTLTGTQILFLLGGLAIATGIYTYSYKVIKTVGSEIFKLSPIAALVVMLAESLVLFIFASESLEKLLINLGLPTIPLVPVSSSQAVVGGVVGIAFARGGGRAINYSLLLKIFVGWILTPLTSGIIAFFSLFFMQNVFQQTVYKPIPYVVDEAVIEKAKTLGLPEDKLLPLKDTVVYGSMDFAKLLKKRAGIKGKWVSELVELAELDTFVVDTQLIKENGLERVLDKEQIEVLKRLQGKIFVHKWQLRERLSTLSDSWRFMESNNPRARLYNKKLKSKYQALYLALRIEELRKLRR